MFKVIIWGCGLDFDLFYNSIMLQALQQKISIVAIISNGEPGLNCRLINGVIKDIPDNLQKYKYDLIIVASKSKFYAIQEEAIKRTGISADKIVRGDLFLLPEFDIIKYLKIVKNTPSLICNTCLGGFIYHSLGLNFSTPYVNLRPHSDDDYLTLLKDIKGFSSCILEKVCDADKYQWTQGKLCYNEKTVILDFPHDIKFTQSFQDWERRKNRINYDNMIILMILDTDDYEKALKFDQLPYENKYLMSAEDYGLKSNVQIKSYTEYEYVEYRSLSAYIHSTFYSDFRGVKLLDVVRLMSNEEFIRII